MANLSEVFPIYDINKKGIIIGDTKGALTVCFRMTLPIVYTLGKNDFQNLIEKFRNFIELLGDDIIIHKQDIFHKEFFSLNNSTDDVSESDFIERSYQLHFNERPYLNGISYLYVSKFNSDKVSDNLISKNYAKTDEQEFINIIFTASEVLKPFISLEFIEYEKLISEQSPISKYYNFSNANIEELKDVNFADNSVYVGTKKIKIFTIENEKQFPTSNIGYSSESNGLPVSNLFKFSYPLGVPHVVNQYIYIPNQTALIQELDKKEADLKGFNVKGANSEAHDEIVLFKKKLSDLGIKGAYYHFNLMCFDDTEENIEKRVNIAFSESGFKKKENTLSRKDLFLSGIPGNAIRLVLEKSRLMSLLTDLECSAHILLEQNYSDSFTGLGGIRLCDRIYGIPFQVDLYDLPKKKGWIKNQNAVVLSGSGGGKSFFTNLIFLNEYRNGSHIFCIDASFSYKLQCTMHNGVYLTFDEENKITFNPFYMGWLKEERAKDIFGKNPDMKDRDINRYFDYLESKINVISGILSTMTKNKGENSTRFEETIYRKLIESYYEDRCIKNQVDNLKFDDFYDFTENELPKILDEKQITKEDFNHRTFLTMLEHFKTGNSLGYLLNSEDEKVKNIENERFIVIDVSRIRENDLLFSIVSVLAMDLYNQKVAKLPLNVRKVLGIDEAWQSISSPEMATFMKGQVKVIRKYGGSTIFISQELDDFISSEIIKESIINNSDIKIFADMGDYKQKFEPIKKIMTISDNNERKIKSINENNRPNSFYKEVCICWGQYAQVYAVETPLELKAIFETDPDEVGVILPQIKNYGVELTAINYANR